MNKIFHRSVAAFVLFTVLSPVVAEPILLEVEDFKGPWRKQTNISGFLGKGFCTSNAKDPNIATTTMDGSAEIIDAGTYAVWTRGYTSENSARAYAVQVGETVFPPTHTGSERLWTWQKAGEVTLTVGAQPVKVHDAADGFESVDAILLTRDLALDPDAALEEQRRWLVYPEGLPDVADPLRFNIEASRKALAMRTDPATASEWEERAPKVRTALQDGLGLLPWPEKNPLNAKISGRAERDFYFVENLVFESRPNFYVTANVYIPKKVELPAPAVVVVPGHAMEDAKNYDLYQMGQLGMVKEGIIVLAYDPIGQGERKLPGFGHNLGYGSLLVGQTNEGNIVWDSIRAVDYLTTREDVDASRIGIAGNSGGGENVFYTMPMDERIQAGTSFSFVCSYDLWLAEGGNHCICNHIPGIAHEMEEFEIIGLNAPRPFLAGNGSKDNIFPVAGFKQTIERAKGIYGLAGNAEKVEGTLAPLGHGWSQPLREAGWGWMNQWLLGKGDGAPIPEEGFKAEDPKSMDILALKGEGMPEGAETVVTLNRKRAEAMIAAYNTPPATKAEWEARAPEWRAEIWGVLGGKPQAFTPVARTVSPFEHEGLRVEVLSIAVEKGMEVGALYARPADSNGEQAVTIFLGGHDEKRLAVLSGYAAEAAKRGPVLVLDPRGTGESQKHENHLTSDSIVLGRPLFGQQVWDVLQASRYLASRGDVHGEQIALYGEKSGGLTALYAAALEPGIAKVSVKDVLASYRYFLEDDQPQPISLCVPGILKVADIPQIAALAAPTPLEVVGLIGYGDERLEESATDWQFARGVYTLSESEYTAR
jgi:cephalosporin-C deacetylase-like acetyl esterase